MTPRSLQYFWLVPSVRFLKYNSFQISVTSTEYTIVPSQSSPTVIVVSICHPTCENICISQRAVKPISFGLWLEPSVPSSLVSRFEFFLAGQRHAADEDTRDRDLFRAFHIVRHLFVCGAAAATDREQRPRATISFGLTHRMRKNANFSAEIRRYNDIVFGALRCNRRRNKGVVQLLRNDVRLRSEDGRSHRSFVHWEARRRTRLIAQ